VELAERLHVYVIIEIRLTQENLHMKWSEFYFYLVVVVVSHVCALNLCTIFLSLFYSYHLGGGGILYIASSRCLAFG
jgi:hypothetical protein